MSQLVTWVPHFILSREEMLGRKKRIWNRREHVTNISLVADIKRSQIKFRSLLYLVLIFYDYTQKRKSYNIKCLCRKKFSVVCLSALLHFLLAGVIVISASSKMKRLQSWSMVITVTQYLLVTYFSCSRCQVSALRAIVNLPGAQRAICTHNAHMQIR